MKTAKKIHSPGGKTARLFIALSLGIFIILLLSSFVWFPRTGILPVFKGNWVLFKAVSNILIILPAFSSALVLLSLALFPKFLKSSTGSFRSYAVFFILLMMVYTVFKEIIGPRIENRLMEIQEQTQTGEELIDAAYYAETREDYATAYQSLKLYREIDSQNQDINRAFDRIRLLLTEESEEKAVMEESEAPLSDPEAPANSAEEIAGRAAFYLQIGEYHSAYHFATIAENLGNKNASAIKEEAWTKISTMQTGPESEQSIELFSRKAQGISALSFGNLIEAYYLFTELSIQYPEDSEIRGYLEEARVQVKEKMFFLEEAEQALAYPGYKQLFFILEKSDSALSFFYADTCVIASTAVFLQNIEIISIDMVSGQARTHYRVPYGKITDGKLACICIHSTDPGQQYPPQSLIESGKTDLPETLAFPVPPEDLRHFSKARRQPIRLSFGELLKLRTLKPVYGYPAEPVYIEILMRIFYPFSFLVFAFFSLSLGIRTKQRQEGFTLASFILIPILPVMLYFIIQFFYYLNRVILTLIHLWLGFYAALIALFIIQGALLVFSIAASYKKMH